VTETHGTKIFEGDNTNLLSDLPMLMAMYEPGMTLASITALYEEGDKELLAAVQMRLSNKDRQTLGLVEIGSDTGEEWAAEKKDFASPIERISIVSD